jgi:flagellin
MGLRVSTNIASVNAQRNLISSQREIAKSMNRLASGSRINMAADDAAGLAISETLKSHIRSNRQATRNANDGLSLVETAEGAFQEVSKIIIRLRELGIQAASDTVGDVERSFLNREVVQMKSEIDRIARVTTWNGTKLLDGSSDRFDLQVGLFANPEQNAITFDPQDNNVTLSALGLSDIDFSNKEDAQAALSNLDYASDHLNGVRSNLGAIQNRLVATMNNLAVQEENMSAANSRIRDTDMAHASSESVRNDILIQASTATLTQANQIPQLALRLIG